MDSKMDTKTDPTRFSVVGHVDHGKSTLCGHILYLTGTVSEHEMKNITAKAEADKMLSHKWSRVLDIYEEEQRKGKTNEYTSTVFSYRDKQYHITDTPGHKAFIRSMIAGISNTPQHLACLIISGIAKEFEAGFERGQTREDILLIRASGITNIIVAINKMDVVQWDETVFKGHVARLDKFLKQLNFTTIKYIPISGFQGVGIINLDNMPKWYSSNKCLIDLIDEVASTSTTDLQVSSSNTDVYKTKLVVTSFTVLSYDSVLTIGYEGVCHYNGGEVFYKIEKVVSVNGKAGTFGKTKDKLEVLISFEYVINLKKEDKLIFRDKENTVGFGKVLKIKPA